MIGCFKAIIVDHCKKQPITKETFIFETFFHISLARSFSYSLFFNTTSLFSKLKVQNILYFKVSSKHARNNCVFCRFKIPTVPILQTLPFAKIFKNVYGELLAQSVEGFVITVPCKGAIFKWKGYEDNDPRRVESLIEISGEYLKLIKNN